MKRQRFAMLTALVARKAAIWSHESAHDLTRATEWYREQPIDREAADRFVTEIRQVLDQIAAEARGAPT